jgi:hypothetical protein
MPDHPRFGARRRNAPAVQPSHPSFLRGGNSAKGLLQEKTMVWGGLAEVGLLLAKYRH